MDTGKVLLGALAGVAAGVLVGILIAPEKGSKTRRNIMDKGDEYLDELKSKFDEFVETIAEKYEMTRNDAEELISKSKLKYDEARKDGKHQLSEV